MQKEAQNLLESFKAKGKFTNHAGIYWKYSVYKKYRKEIGFNSLEFESPMSLQKFVFKLYEKSNFKPSQNKIII